MCNQTDVISSIYKSTKISKHTLEFYAEKEWIPANKEEELREFIQRHYH
jgi:DNA-binding transcriptional MerR regulator